MSAKYFFFFFGNFIHHLCFEKKEKKKSVQKFSIRISILLLFPVSFLIHFLVILLTLSRRTMCLSLFFLSYSIYMTLCIYYYLFTGGIILGERPCCSLHKVHHGVKRQYHFDIFGNFQMKNKLEGLLYTTSYFQL